MSLATAPYGVDLGRDDVDGDVLQDADDGGQQPGAVGGLDVELRVRARGVLGQGDACAHGGVEGPSRPAAPARRGRPRPPATCSPDASSARVPPPSPQASARRTPGGIEEVAEDGDADLLDAGGLDDLNGSCFLFFWRFLKGGKKMGLALRIIDVISFCSLSLLFSPNDSPAIPLSLSKNLTFSEVAASVMKNLFAPTDRARPWPS